MQFSKVLLAAASFAVTMAVPQFTMPTSFFVTYTAGSPMNLTWSNAAGPVTLYLKNGPASALNTVETIQSGLTGTSYIFTPSASLANGPYAFEIDDSTGPNYSAFFTLTGGSASVSASTTGSSTASAATTSSISNSTTTASKTATKSSSSTTGTSSSTSPTSSSTTPKINSATNIASPLALVFLALAAMVTLN